jgi:hypothetical protein
MLYRLTSMHLDRLLGKPVADWAAPDHAAFNDVREMVDAEVLGDHAPEVRKKIHALQARQMGIHVIHGEGQSTGPRPTLSVINSKRSSTGKAAQS